MWWAASARRSDPLGQSAKSLELREIKIGSLLFSSQREKGALPHAATWALG